MNKNETTHVLVAILILFVISGVSLIIAGNYLSLMQVFVFSVIVIGVHVFAKNLMAYLLDAGVEHRIWHVYRYGWKAKQHFKKELPFGIIVPFVFSVFSLGLMKVGTVLTYETRALKRRAARRFGFYSYTEITEWHNGLVGVTGIVAVLLVALISYFPDLELLSKMAAYYAFVNMLPVSDLDGTQIFFGSKIIWTVLEVISLIFLFYALVL